MSHRSPLFVALTASTTLGACNHLLDIPDRAFDSNLVCEGGKCICKNDFDNCNGKAEDGCEAFLSDDPSNCGRCGHDCLGGQCKRGQCQPTSITSLPPAPSYITSLLVHDGYVYASDCPYDSGTRVEPTSGGGAKSRSRSSRTGQFLRAPIEGGQLEPLFTTPVPCTTYFGIEGDKIYWSATEQQIYFAPLDGSGPIKSIKGPSSDAAQLPFAVGGDYVYWVESGFGSPYATSRTLNRTRISTNSVEQILPQSEELYTYALFANQDGAYLVAGGRVSLIPHQGQPQAAFTASTLYPVAHPHIALRGEAIYWAEMPPGPGKSSKIYGASLQGGGATLYTDSDSAYWPAIVADESAVFWFDGRATLNAMNVQDRSITELVTDSRYIEGLFALDKKAVYWVSGADKREVLKIAR